MAASPSSSRPSPLSRSPLFTPIPELEKEEEDDDELNESEHNLEPEPEPERHHPTSLPAKSPAPNRHNRQLSVLCTNCRPSTRDHKTTVVPLDNSSNYKTTPNAKTILHNLLLTLTGSKTPKNPPVSTSTPVNPTDSDYKHVAEELSHKLVHVTRKRDQALLEVSRLKHEVSELERKVDQLKASADRSADSTVMEVFPEAVAEARKTVRVLTRFLSGHVRPGRVAALVKLPIQDSSSLLVFVEGLLNRVFYNEFDKVSDEDSKILDPTTRCETNQRNYDAVRNLTWEEVLHKGTKHYSEGLSKFCDKKMSEVVNMVGWARAWPENLLQAFFRAAKSVWIVYLLGRCVYPAVPIMKVERGFEFNGKYMEDVKKGVAVVVSVRMMVAPGFYVWSNGSWGVIKCKVVCGYGENESSKLEKISD